MKSYKLICILLLVLAVSCNRQSEDQLLEKLPLLSAVPPPADGDSIVNYVIIMASQYAGLTDTANAYSVDVLAGFDTTAGSVIINGRTFSPDPGGRYSGDYSNDLVNGKAMFGTDVNVELTSLGIQRTVYVPSIVFPTALPIGYRTIPFNTNFQLNWQPDPLNVFGKVLIQVDYYASMSNALNAGLPTSIAPLRYEVNDNGGYRIPAEDLNNFPVDAHIQISVSRAVRVTDLITTRTRIEYLAVMCAYSGPIVIVP